MDPNRRVQDRERTAARAAAEAKRAEAERRANRSKPRKSSSIEELRTRVSSSSPQGKSACGEFSMTQPRGHYAPPGIYVVIAKLSERGGEFEYYIKHTSELHERIAMESELHEARR